MAAGINSDADEIHLDTFGNCNSNYIVENDLENFLKLDQKAAANFMHVNCRSLSKNFDSLHNLIGIIPKRLTAIAVSETWTTSITEKNFNIDGYNFICNSRTSKLGGGVGFFIDSDFSFSIRDDLLVMKDYLECVFVEINQKDSVKIIVGCVYRPPNSDLNLFNANLITILNILNVKKNKIPTFIMGDFNLDLLHCDTHSPTEEFLNNFISHSYLPTIRYPTRVTEFSATLLDNIFTNNIHYMMDSAILYNDISDHLPVILHVNLKLDKVKKCNTISKRLYNEESISNFKHELTNVNWTDLYAASNSDDAKIGYSLFLNKFTELFESNFPLKCKNLNNSQAPRQVWITNGLIKSCRKKSNLYRKYKKAPTTENRLKYISYRNKLKSILQKAEKSYYRNKLKQFEGNLTQTWKLLGKVTNKSKQIDVVDNFAVNGCHVVNKQDVVEHFNKFFVEIGDSLAKTIPPASKSFSSFLQSDVSCANSFVLFMTDIDEILEIVNNFDNKTSYGYDSIPVHIMKQCINEIAAPLVALVNCSFRSGQFPDELKIAKVCPIFKSGDKNIFSNYRPISVLPSFSKIFEKAMFNRLLNYLNINNSLAKNQYGFRPKHSTYMAIQDMYDKISKSLDDREVSIGIFIDLSKAFDTLNHSILLKKLEHYGIRGVSLNWFIDYLSHRKQYVRYNETSSSSLIISCGVPQGSILGPLLFILYMNDIANCSNILHFILFADDTNIFYSCKNYLDLMNVVNEELVKLSNWFRANKLSLNVKKTHYILFGSNRKKINCTNFSIVLEGNNLDCVSNTKFLGVHIDEELNWKHHTAQIALKISKGLGILNRVKYILPCDVLLMLYYTMIHSYLLYCNIIWGNACQVSLYRLTCLQKRAIRLITRSEYRAHTSPLFKKLCILKLVDIYKLQTLLYMYKARNNMLPQGCIGKVTCATNDTHYNFRNNNDFLLINFKTEIRRKCIAISGPNLWMSISDSIKYTQSIIIFKTRLLQSFFEIY